MVEVAPRGQTALSLSHTSLILRLGTAAALFTLLATLTPPSDPSIRLCGFYHLTGHPCPFCGLTRAVFALAKGHFAQAEHFNALAPLGFTMLFSLFLSGKATVWLWRIGLPAFAIYGVWRFFVTQ